MRLGLLLLVVLFSTPAAAQVHGVAHQRLVALLNPMGAEHTLRTGLRAPLGDPDELLFSGAHAEAGAVSYVSPVYAVHGGYLEVSPLAFLVLSAEVTGTTMWPIGMDGAGYYGLDRYDADVRAQTLSAERGERANGWEVTLGATLQGAIPLGPTRLLIADAVAAQHASMHGVEARSSHYYSLRHDLVLAEQDWVISNDAVALVDITLIPGTRLMIGAYDALRYVPASGYVGHQVGPLVALTFERPADVIDGIDLYVRGGVYTDHVTRAEQPTVLGGVTVHYDLGALR